MLQVRRSGRDYLKRLQELHNPAGSKRGKVGKGLGSSDARQTSIALKLSDQMCRTGAVVSPPTNDVKKGEGTRGTSVQGRATIRYILKSKSTAKRDFQNSGHWDLGEKGKAKDPTPRGSTLRRTRTRTRESCCSQRKTRKTLRSREFTDQ